MEEPKRFQKEALDLEEMKKSEGIASAIKKVGIPVIGVLWVGVKVVLSRITKEEEQ